jgi:hypothetical protein
LVLKKAIFINNVIGIFATNKKGSLSEPFLFAI